MTKPYAGQSLEPGRAAALAGLRTDLADLLDAGATVPCLGYLELWCSEDPDDQETAASACLDCPAMQRCDEYVSAWPEAAGTWAGLTEWDRDNRRPNKGAHRKDNN